MIKDVLWEVDGTLFDTYPAITYAVSQALQALGHTTALNTIDGLARRSIDGCLQALAQRFDLAPDRLRRRFDACYREVPPARQPSFPGVRAACAFIHRRGGVNLAIIHRDPGSIQPLLKVHGLVPFFREVLSTRHGLSGLPYPGFLRIALESYGLQPGTTLLVTDRETGVQAGRLAQVRTCHYGQATAASGAEISITDYAELLDRLRNEK